MDCCTSLRNLEFLSQIWIQEFLVLMCTFVHTFKIKKTAKHVLGTNDTWKASDLKTSSLVYFSLDIHP